jgi:hypothetical protein
MFRSSNKQTNKSRNADESMGSYEQWQCYYCSELSSGIYCRVKWLSTDVSEYAPLKRRSKIILHGSISQKTILNIILAAVRTWNLTSYYWFPLRYQILVSHFKQYIHWVSAPRNLITPCTVNAGGPTQSFSPYCWQPVAWDARHVCNDARLTNAHAFISLCTDRGVVYILISLRDELNGRSFEWWTVMNGHAHCRHACTQGDGYNTPALRWGLAHH